MFNLTLSEQFLVAAVLLAIVTGTVVKHWRASHREAQPALVAAPSAGRR